MLLVFGKKVLHRKLCTQEMLQRKGFHSASICVLCRKAEEYVDHLFIKCPFAQLLWSVCSLKLNVKLQACETVEALAVQFKKLINGSGKICAIAKLAFGAVIWNISTEKNIRFIKNRSVQRSKVMNTICESSRGSDDRPLNNNNNSINININYYIYIKDRMYSDEMLLISSRAGKRLYTSYINHNTITTLIEE